MSYYPTLSGGWSNPYQVQRDTDLPFLLTVQKMRWQVRMTSESARGHADARAAHASNHAPVQFPTSATAVTVPIGPIDGKYLLTWGDLILSADVPAGSRPHRERARRRRRAGRRADCSHRRTGATIALDGVAVAGQQAGGRPRLHR